MLLSIKKKLLLAGGILALCTAGAQDKKQQQAERAYYQVSNLQLPDSVLLEVGGFAFTDDGRLGVATRRGEIWIITNPEGKGGKKPTYRRFARGLHETLGLAYRNGAFYATQRSEITRVTDTNGDGKADRYETVSSWPLSGNYHEYSYGPLFLPNGNMLVNLNLSWVGRGESLAKWRGWTLQVTPQGRQLPFAAGLRSPAGMAVLDNGDIFFSENQGDWIPTGYLTHLEQGDFAGHPASLRWAAEKASPVKGLSRDMFPDSIGSQYAFAQKNKAFKLPAIIFPHTLMGISTCALLPISNDAFGPYKGQILVGDQGHSKIMRAYLEKVNGKYQGACFPFLEGFRSGILRMAWSADNSLFVGMTSRGWAATGTEWHGVEKVRFSGKVPFEIKAMKAKSNGFELEFTQPVDRKLAADVQQYALTSFTYSYHKKYGSPIVDTKPCTVLKAEVAPDGRSVRLYLTGLRAGYVHQVDAPKLKSASGAPLLHGVGYYTLNNIPAATAADKQVMAGLEHKGHHGGHDMPAASGCGAEPAKNVTVQPASWKGGPDKVISIGTKPGLKFDLSAITVKEGTRVKLIFNNNDDMLHNLVITKGGKWEVVGKAAMELGLKGSGLGYVPKSDDVLFNTCVLQPEGAQAIYFIAPKAGNYDYICSFPGHFYAMKGVMKVVK